MPTRYQWPHLSNIPVLKTINSKSQENRFRQFLTWDQISHYYLVVSVDDGMTKVRNFFHIRLKVSRAHTRSGLLNFQKYGGITFEWLHIIDFEKKNYL